MRYGTIIPENPRTIQEKLMWLQFYDKANYLKPICADKLKVREYAKDTIGVDIGVPLLKTYNSPDEIRMDELPDKFVLKTNHSNNQVLICNEKNKFNIDEAKKKIKVWLSRPFGVMTCEPHYLYIDRKCYSEKLISAPGVSPIDYRLWMFNGRLKLISVNSGYGHGKIERYDENFIFRNTWNDPTTKQTFKKPESFNTMVQWAEKLSEPFAFVRVDFFECSKTPYLAEMTFVPGACNFHFPTKNLDIYFGDMIKL